MMAAPSPQNSLALSLGAVICGAAAGSANADTTPPGSETISMANLDRWRADGARALLKRIDIAAQRACGGDPVRSPLVAPGGAPAQTPDGALRGLKRPCREAR